VRGSNVWAGLWFSNLVLGSTVRSSNNSFVGRYIVGMCCGLDGTGFEMVLAWTVQFSNILWTGRYEVRIICGLDGTGF
jgi:hypothetical protein